MDGWIKLHRKILDNPIVCKDADYLAVWIYLLLNATHDEIVTMFKGEKIVLKPGQLITGRKIISEKLGISESKTYRIINAYKSEHQIEQQTSNKNSLISICNWSEYQNIEQQNETPMNNKRTTSEQQVNTNKNVKNDNNIKESITKVIPKKSFVPPTVDEVKEYCLQKGYGMNPEEFVDFYLSKNWYVGKNKMTDWKAAVRNWERKEKEKTVKPKKQSFDQRTYDYDKLEKQLLANRLNKVKQG